MAAKLKDRDVILVCEGTAYRLSSPDGVCTENTELSDSSQEETDSRVFLYCLNGKQQGYRYVRVKSLDTDIFSILLCYADDLSDITVLFDTGKGNQKRLFDMSCLTKGLTQQYCTARRVLHAFTGCNTTSAFKGKGKIRPITLVKSKSSFIETFASLGSSWKVFEHTLVELEEFTCLVYKTNTM